MTSTVWDIDSMNPTGWWLTEKFDGIRMYWNGSELYTRQGNTIKIPDSMRSRLPKSISLDGELW
jgi:DNA ligase-1